MRYLLYTIKRANIIERIDAGRQTTVKAEDLVVDEGGEGEIVEEVSKVLPDTCVAIFSQALVVETVDLRDLAGLVVSAKYCNTLRVSDLEGNKEGYGLDRVVSTINVIT